MNDVLTEIVEVKRREVERLKVQAPLALLEERIAARRPPLNLAGALLGDSVRIIAEVKKASPVKGLLRPDFDAATLATEYVEGGAAAISVLTNVDHFQGSLDDLEAVQAVAYPRGVPVLRKDFIVDPYQVYESRAYQADALLLIVAPLTDPRLRELLDLARELGMHCLVEVHTSEEARRAVDAGAQVIGINNRDLRSFETKLETTRRVRPAVPKGHVVVSESGIKSGKDVRRLAAWGVDAFLIGEALMTAPDPGARLREFLATHD